MPLVRSNTAAVWASDPAAAKAAAKLRRVQRERARRETAQSPNRRPPGRDGRQSGSTPTTRYRSRMQARMIKAINDAWVPRSRSELPGSVAAPQAHAEGAAIGVEEQAVGRGGQPAGPGRRPSPGGFQVVP